MARRRSVNLSQRKARAVTSGSNRVPIRCMTTAATRSSSSIRSTTELAAGSIRSSISSRRTSMPRITKASRTRSCERNYTTFIRGGAGINFGHEKWWPFGVTGLFDGGANWLGILSEPPQLSAKYAWDLLDTYVRENSWRPDSGAFLKTGLGRGDDKAASGYSSSAGVIYFPTSRSITVDTTAINRAGNVKIRWYDPTNGMYTVIAHSEPKNSSRSISYPDPATHTDDGRDWVLVVEGE